MGDARRRRTTITPPLCGPCGRQHDPAEACDPEAALRVFTPSRSAGQDDADHLEAVAVSCYTFHRPRHRSARNRRGAVVEEGRVEPGAPPAASPPRILPVSLPLAIAVLVAFLAANLVLTVLIAAGLH